MNISEIIVELRDVEKLSILTPAQLSEYLCLLSARIDVVGKHIIEKEQAYSFKWDEIRELTDSDKQADNKIKQTDQYKELEQAKYIYKAVMESIRSLKKMLTVKSDELRNMC